LAEEGHQADYQSGKAPGKGGVVEFLGLVRG
jgi:hypothetical protein